ncbi:DASS family sodium-coupled anion symporter [Sessilibacter sp. MAH1]
MTAQAESNTSSESVTTPTTPMSKLRLFSIVAGPLVCLILTFIPAPEGLSPGAWKLVALTTWMVIWWMTEAAPVPVTALLPIVFMPILGIGDQKTVAASYSNPLIYLFLGGFLIAAAMQRWGLHKRIALTVVKFAGTSGSSIIAGFMLSTAFLSMWISNTATTLMMFTVGISLIDFIASKGKDPAQVRRFGIALMLGIAYSASIGGVATLIGTPPNTLLASFLQDSYGISIDFATWMMIGVPVAVILLPIVWFILCKLVFPVGHLDLEGADQLVVNELNAMGKIGRGELIVLIVFGFTVVAWIFRKFIISLTGLNISDTSIALFAASILFVIPASIERNQFTVDWDAAKGVPWGVLLLFGGGLALAAAFKSTGLAMSIGEFVGSLDSLEISMIILVTIITIVFLTEITSNTATTATFLPILGAVSVGLGYSPLALAIPAALAASMAFMMPVATPPNAIVFSYEGLRIKDMMKAGLWINLVSIFIIYIAIITLAPTIFGIDL